MNRVWVTHVEDVDTLWRLSSLLPVDTIQVHAETIDNKDLNSLLQSNKTIIRTIHVENKHSIQSAKAVVPFCHAILLDTKTSKALGGTGETHNWEWSKAIVQQVNVPVILAGGLNPQNVQKAVDFVKPFGVDVNTGLNVDGFKDSEKVKQFIKNAKSCS